MYLFAELSDSITVQSTLNIRIDATMSGTFDLIVFHVRPDGETVGDTAHISADQCFQHQVGLTCDAPIVVEAMTALGCSQA